MVTYRIDRINKEFLRSISELLRTRIKNEAVRQAILTDVSVSRDLGHAKVYYTLLDESKKDSVQEALEASAGQIRSILGREMRLRTIPELRFRYDDTETKARMMDDLLDRVISRDAARGEGAAPEA